MSAESISKALSPPGEATEEVKRARSRHLCGFERTERPTEVTATTEPSHSSGSDAGSAPAVRHGEPRKPH
jgi:hypothetical protein